MNHLHVRSCYSLLESGFKLEDIIDHCLQKGFYHACLTEHNSLFSVMKFWHLCKEKGVHPIIGLETEAILKEKEFHFILLAKNDTGLKELYKISTLKMSSETLSFEQLALSTQNCVVLTASDYEDELASYIIKEKDEEILSFVNLCKEAWKDFYVSIAMNDSSFHRQRNRYLKDLISNLVKTVALSRIYYGEKEDVENLKVLRAIARQTTLNDATLDVSYNRYFRTIGEMEELYDEQDLKATDEICEMCNVQMAFKRNTLPVFKNQYNADSNTFLNSLCKAGLKKRLNGHVKENYVKRLQYELHVIQSMGFTDYFLIVWDFIRYARSKEIMVGPGRGSVAGSLVAYCLGITHIDPIENDLLFERFLNPDRISMPDIDTDFPDNRREEVIQYVINRYGNQKASHIVTFNTMKTKQVLRDVSRCMSMPVRKVDELIRVLEEKETLLEAYHKNTNFRKKIEQDVKYQELFKRALPLEGLPRHASIHAAGIILSQQDIVEVCPLMKVDENTYASQFTMEYLEELGLIKMDFLGLKNLSTIDQILKTIESYLHVSLDILKIPLNDAKTYQLLSNADTVGVFQLESEGIKQLLYKMKPNQFEDICAILALYRPGPMHNIDEYIERKKDPSKVTYLHPLLEPVLKDTYGIMIYQEQIMKTAQVIGGFSLSQADNLRKAMSKKNMEMMESFKVQFLQGAYQKGISQKVALEIFVTMERFAQYGFNKSHSYAYGLIVYQMAYLKANYPFYFYKCLLDSVIGSEKKTMEYIYECQKRNIQILKPSVLYSYETYSIEEKGLRMPLQVLKGIGKSVYPLIIEQREKQEYQNFIEFVVRTKSISIEDSVLKIFIDGGALDCFEYNRETMRANLQKVLDYAHLVCTQTSEGTLLCYDIVSPPSIVRYSDNPMADAQKEFDVFGFYLTMHPIKELRKQFPKSTPIQQVLSINGYVNVLGKVNGFRTHKTKNGQWMCFMTIEDEKGRLDVVVMPDLYKLEKENIQKNRFVYVNGKKDRPNSILAKSFKWILEK
ncbi:MAG: DNA polymerase III subunit alpha [Floccifex porci]|uniref:DNA polymerase III subunit alpha n=1 Tax=Floccifex porci TaxID=2606629 RepID=UPI003F126468